MIGDAAKNQAEINSIFNVKRLMGLEFDDLKNLDDLQHWPFEVVNDRGKPIICVSFNDEKQNFAPEEICTMILTKIEQMAAAYFNTSIKDVVLTVPTYFNDLQREATKATAAKAGLNVLSLIDEPSAVALAYGLNKNLKDKCCMLVFNLGSYALDISIFGNKEGSPFEVKATAIDTRLGGKNFDNRLLNYFIEDFKNKHKKDPSSNQKALHRLRIAAKHAKHNLSTNTEAIIEIVALFEGIDYRAKVTRGKFEELCADLFVNIVAALQQALIDAHMEKTQIQNVILVGNSTSMPKVQTLLQAYFKGKRINSSMKPNEVVAYGAAIQAAILSGGIECSPILAIQKDPSNLKGNGKSNSKSLNLIIEACKENDAKLLEQLLDEQMTMRSENEDDTSLFIFYYVIRTGNVELLDMFINKWTANNLDTHLRELDEFLSQAYEKLKLMNVPLSEEMEIFVENKLINLRFFSNATKQEQNLQSNYASNIEERIDFVLQNISLLDNEYSEVKEVDEKFLFLLKLIAQNMHVLKRQLKSTYDRLPWEELEFCLISFISSHVKRQEINLFYNFTLNKRKILDYLKYFATKLNDKKSLNLLTRKSNELPKLRREKIVTKIINDSPEFAELYTDYKQIKDIHSLEKISTYIKLALSADAKDREGQLVITRVLQVIGEYLKNTLESPNLSSSTSELLLLTLPKSTRQAIIDLRNSLSHAFSLAKRTEIEENSDLNFFINVQNDTKKIDNIISGILHKNKIKVIRDLLAKISVSNSLKELHEYASILDKLQVDKMLTANFQVIEYVRLEELIKKLDSKLTEKSSHVKKLFDKIATIMKSTTSQSKNIRKDYVQTFKLLEHLGISLRDDSMDRNDMQAGKSFAREILTNISTQLEPQKLKEIAKISRDIYHCANTSDFAEIDRLTCEIFCIAEFESSDLSWIEELRSKLNEHRAFIPLCCQTHNNKKTYNMCDEKYKSQLQAKLSELKNVLTKNDFNESGIKKLPFYKTNKQLQAVVELLVLDIMSILGISAKYLENNQLFLDDNSPLLTGKCLRNHLAHDNTLVDELLSDPSMSVMLNAKKLIAENVIESKRKVGKWIKNDQAQIVARCDKSLATITSLQKMFAALEAGNLTELKIHLENGADIKAKNMHSLTALHFAARGRSLEILKFVLKEKVDVHDRDVNGQSPLHYAAACGMEYSIEFFVKEAGLDVNVVDNRRRTPMHLAAANGHKSNVEMLLKMNADRNIKDIEGYSPVHYAVKNNRIDVAKFMLLQEASVDANDAMGGFTSLHTAAEKGFSELVDFLLENGANVNAKNDKGGIPLHTAALNGHLDIVNALIAKGSVVDSRSIEGCTPLLCAVSHGHSDIALILLKHGANVNAIDETCNKTPLLYAAQNGYTEIVNMLLQRKANANIVTFDDGLTAMHLAARNGHLKTVAALLEHGVQIHTKDKTKATPLYSALERGHTEIVELLLENGAKVNDQDKNNLSPLHVAAVNGYMKICEILIRNKADVNAKDIRGGTPLNSAAAKGNKDIIKLLLKYNADIKCRTSDGMTALHMAAFGGHNEAVALLIESKADVNAAGKNGPTPLHGAIVGGHKDIVELLLKNNAKVEAKGIDGGKALHMAAEAGYRDIVEILLNYGANVNAKFGNFTPLLSATVHNQKEVVEILLTKGADVNAENGKPLMAAVVAGYKNIVNILLENNARINQKYPEGVTLLHLAAQRGHRDIAKALIAKGAKVDAKTPDGLTPLCMAARDGRDEVVKILIENRANVNVVIIQGIPLHLAVVHGHANTAEILLMNGANIHAKDCDNRTSLEMAVAHGKLDVVIVMLKHTKIDLEAKGNDGYTILHIASQEKNIDMVRYLVGKGCNMYAKNNMNSKPIHIAAREGFLDAVKLFLSKGMSVHEFGNDKQTPLHYAVISNNKNLIEYLIAQGADVNAKDDTGLTAMHIAAHLGFKNIAEVLLKNGAIYNGLYKFRTPTDLTDNRSLISFLKSVNDLFTFVNCNNCLQVENCLRAGAYVDARNIELKTPLFYAVLKGYDQIVEILLQNKANPNARDERKFTPLHYAVQLANLNIVKLLLVHGAAYNAVSNTGKKPTDMTTNCDIKNLLTLINDSFAKVKKGNAQLITDLDSLKDIETLKCVMNAQDNEQNTLIVAAVRNDFPKVEKLKEISQGGVSVQINGALLLFSQGKYENALKIFRSVFEKRKELLGPDNPATLEIQSYIAKMQFKQGHYQVALNMLEEIFEKQKTQLGSCNQETLSTSNTIALILHEQGNNEKALKIYQKILPKQKQILGTNHSDTLNTQLHMALVLDKLGKYEEALKLNRSTYEVNKEIQGALDPNTLSAQNNIALVLSNQGKYEESLKIYKEVYEKKKIALGVNHPDTLRTLKNIAGIFFNQNKNHEALKTFREVLDLQKKALPKNHPEILLTQYNIATVLFAQGKFISVLKCYHELLEPIKAVFGPSDPKVINMLESIAVISSQLKFSGSDATMLLRARCEDITFAASKGDLESVKQLLKTGTDVNYEDTEGRTPLHFAVSNGHIEIVNLLLENGADVSRVTNKGNTALHTATSKGNLHLTKTLLQHIERDNLNDFVNAKTTASGSTALHVAAKSGYFELLKCLLQHGAIFNAENKDGKASLELCKQPIIKNLLKSIENIFKDFKNGSVEAINKLRALENDEFLAATNARNDQGNTLLQVAMANGHKHLASKLLELLKKNQINNTERH